MTRRKGAWRSSRGARALSYLRITASPPLGWRNTLAAWRAAWEQGQEKNT
jgi:hypothetical protein